MYGRTHPHNLARLALEHAGAAVAPEARDACVEIVGGDQPQAWTESFQDAKSDCVLESSLESAQQVKGRLGLITWEYDTADVLNGNRRIYPSDVYWPAAESINVEAKAGRIYGELDHPDYYSSDVVSYQNAGVRVLSVEKMNTTRVRVKAAILKNDHGQTIAACYESGGNVAVSHRCFVMWDQPTDEERQQYGLAPDTQAVIARSLRLVTFDVVTKPGFQTAWAKSVSESARTPMKFTIEQINGAENKAEIIQALAGTAVAAREAKIPGEITAAVEAEKPKIIDAATKPLKEQVTKLEADVAAAKATMESFKEMLVKAGVVVEKVDEVKVTKDLAASEAKVIKLEAELAAIKSQAEKTAGEAKAKEDAAALKASVEAVRLEHKDNKHVALIVKAAERGKTPDEVKSIATEEAAKIKALVGNTTTTAKTPMAKETAATGGGGDDPAAQQHAATERLLAGIGGVITTG